MKWLFFGIGLLIGGVVSVFTMCLCVVSGEVSRREERVKYDADQTGV